AVGSRAHSPPGRTGEAHLALGLRTGAGVRRPEPSGRSHFRHVRLSADLQPNANSHLDLGVVGGCGHVGLPLALSFAQAGLRVGIYDIDTTAVECVRGGRMPFLERGGQELLTAVLATGRLELASDPEILRKTTTVVLVIGTPIDEFMNPSTKVF